MSWSEECPPGSQIPIMSLRRMLVIWVCSFPVTWDKDEIPFVNNWVLWFGGKHRQCTSISALPQHPFNQKMRCRIMPWYNWCKTSGVIEQKMCVYRSCSQNEWSTSLIPAPSHALLKFDGSLLALLRAFRTSLRSHIWYWSPPSPISSWGIGQHRHNPVLMHASAKPESTKFWFFFTFLLSVTYICKR